MRISKSVNNGIGKQLTKEELSDNLKSISDLFSLSNTKSMYTGTNTSSINKYLQLFNQEFVSIDSSYTYSLTKDANNISVTVTLINLTKDARSKFMASANPGQKLQIAQQDFQSQLDSLGKSDEKELITEKNK